MESITYKVSCLAAKDKVVALITPDRTNHSVHMHFFGDEFGNKRTPIQVKKATMKFPEGTDNEIIRQMIEDYGPIAGLQVKRVSKVTDKTAMTGTPMRII